MLCTVNVYVSLSESNTNVLSTNDSIKVWKFSFKDINYARLVQQLAAILLLLISIYVAKRKPNMSFTLQFVRLKELFEASHDPRHSAFLSSSRRRRNIVNVFIFHYDPADLKDYNLKRICDYFIWTWRKWLIKISLFTRTYFSNTRWHSGLSRGFVNQRS